MIFLVITACLIPALAYAVPECEHIGTAKDPHNIYIRESIGQPFDEKAFRLSLETQLASAEFCNNKKVVEEAKKNLKSLKEKPKTDAPPTIISKPQPLSPPANLPDKRKE